jgi:hypothetical protein
MLATVFVLLADLGRHSDGSVVYKRYPADPWRKVAAWVQCGVGCVFQTDGTEVCEVLWWVL